MCTPCCIARAKAGIEGDPLEIGACPAHWLPDTSLRREQLRVTFEGRHFLGHVVAPPEDAGKRPAVLIVHNFQGLKFFDVQVAEYFARVGYVGVAVDLYGDAMGTQERLWPGFCFGFVGFLKKAFQAMADVDYDFARFRSFLQAWLDAALAHPAVDSSLAPAMMGYCFGGVACIEAVRGGLNLSASISLHGLLQTGEDANVAKWGATRKPLVPCENHYNTKTVLYIENGEQDEMVPEESMRRFTEEMDAAGVKYSVHNFSGAGHGFALPKSLGPVGCLHEEADRGSTLHILELLLEVYPSVPQNRVERNAAGTRILDRLEQGETLE